MASAVWIRGAIVSMDSTLLFLFAARPAPGSAAAFRLLRIVSVITVIPIMVIVALPAALPVWMRSEQGIYGVLTHGAVVANAPGVLSEIAGWLTYAEPGRIQQPPDGDGYSRAPPAVLRCLIGHDGIAPGAESRRNTYRRDKRRDVQSVTITDD